MSEYTDIYPTVYTELIASGGATPLPISPGNIV